MAHETPDRQAPTQSDREQKRDSQGVDPDLVRKFSFTVWSYKMGEMISLMVHLGDRLGLYRTLGDSGPVTATQLAETTGLSERWLLEWLRGQAAAKLVEYRGDDTFELSPVQAAVLAEEDSSAAFACGAFGPPFEPGFIDKLENAFRTGRGLTYDEQGPITAHRTERMLGPWTRTMLVPVIIPALDGVLAKLEAGAEVADVGCGAGVAVLALARAFPRSTFHGFDPSEHAIELANQRGGEADLPNVRWHLARGEDLPKNEEFDFLLTFDCVHDMTRPDLVMQAIRGALKPDGTWLIKDIRSKATYEENLENPMLALLYGFSVTSCMSSALSEPDGMGLGTVGFNPEVAEGMVMDAGFSSFQMHDFDDPANLYYEVRP